MRMEAEFYGIQKIIDHIDFLETEKKGEATVKGKKDYGNVNSENREIIPKVGVILLMERSVILVLQSDKFNLCTRCPRP